MAGIHAHSRGGDRRFRVGAFGFPRFGLLRQDLQALQDAGNGGGGGCIAAPDVMSYSDFVRVQAQS